MWNGGIPDPLSGDWFFKMKRKSNVASRKILWIRLVAIIVQACAFFTK
jgi:hypothetical protein